MFPPDCLVPGSDLEINPTLKFLCLNMTEHALGGEHFLFPWPSSHLPRIVSTSELNNYEHPEGYLREPSLQGEPDWDDRLHERLFLDLPPVPDLPPFLLFLPQMRQTKPPPSDGTHSPAYPQAP